MNPLKILLSVVVAFVAISATDYLVHEVWLSSAYAQDAGKLWRAKADMESHMSGIFVGQFIAAVAFAMLWARIALGGAGIQCAVALGFFFGLFNAGVHVIQGAVQPIPDGLLPKWIVADILQLMLVGVAVFFVHKPVKPCPNVRGQ